MPGAASAASAAVFAAAIGAAAVAAFCGGDSPPPLRPPEPRWIVGDLHVHVSPPDAEGHSSLDVAGVIAKARGRGLDFVVLAPHHADRSFGPSPETGDTRIDGQAYAAKLAREAIAAADAAPRDPGAAAPPPIVVVPGWEFTRTAPGHQTLAFFEMKDLALLDGDAKARRVVEGRGLSIVNHPFFRPVKMLPLVEKVVGGLRGESSGDWRWRPFFGEGSDALAWNAIEVWHERSALLQRTHSHVAAEYPDTQMVRDALAAWDRATKEQRRRITGVGGSDCHGRLPYAMLPLRATSVLVASLDSDSLRDGLLGARVTFGGDAGQGGAAVRDFAATSDVEGERATIGGSVRAESEVRLTWTGVAALVEDGVTVGEFEGGAVRPVDPPGSFHAWRIEKRSADAWSNMIYANLP